MLRWLAFLFCFPTPAPGCRLAYLFVSPLLDEQYGNRRTNGRVGLIASCVFKVQEHRYRKCNKYICCRLSKSNLEIKAWEPWWTVFYFTIMDQ
jgi:hypothetical protein